jgi:aminoacylase
MTRVPLLLYDLSHVTGISCLYDIYLAFHLLFCLSLSVSAMASSSAAFDVSGMATMSAVDLFRQYIRIRTDHPQPDYQACIEFLTAYLTQRVGIAAADIRIVHATDANKPSLFATIHGSDRSLPSILLNSHTDVVPVDRSRWTVEPFDGVQQPDTRRIYGRGTQDMKCVTIQYLEALRTLLHKQQSGELPKVWLAYHNTYMHLRR